jgi:hypothetical protein
MWKVWHNSSLAAAEEERANEAREAEAARLTSQQQRQDAERASRAASVPAIEASIKTMAEEHAGKGLIDGSIISVTCSPVSGGSTGDLTESTTVFECFAATRDNGDGTKSGYKSVSHMESFLKQVSAAARWRNPAKCSPWRS